MHILRTILFTFPMVPTKRICWQSRACQGGDHFSYSYELNVWLRGDSVRRNTGMLLIGVDGLSIHYVSHVKCYVETNPSFNARCHRWLFKKSASFHTVLTNLRRVVQDLIQTNTCLPFHNIDTRLDIDNCSHFPPSCGQVSSLAHCMLYQLAWWLSLKAVPSVGSNLFADSNSTPLYCALKLFFAWMKPWL